MQLHIVPDPTPEELRDAGMDLVLQHQTDRWKLRFKLIYDAYVRLGLSFTSEDIVKIVGMPPGHPNAVGAMFSSLVTPDLEDGRVVYLQHIKSQGVKSHASRIGQYRGRR